MKLIAKNITKDYPGVRALDNISLELESGKVHALIGKNGSGKSTLVKIFAGAIQPTSGELFMDGSLLHLNSPSEAHTHGIVTVYQETSLIPDMSVAENVFLNKMPKRGAVIDWKRAYREAEELLLTMGVELDPKSPVSLLSMWQRQIVEITKAMSFNPRVLMLDEPTSALAQNEVSNLLKFVRTLRQKDIVIIYITHKLQELADIADDITVLRDGKFIGTAEMNSIDHKGIINMMFGEVSIRSRPADMKAQDDIVMRVKNLTRSKYYHDVSFELRKGEVLGIAGMLGSGRSELLRGIFKADPVTSGVVELGGERITHGNPIQMINRRMGITPEDRKTDGLILYNSIKDNLNYASMRKTAIGGFIENRKLRNEYSRRQIEALAIRTSSENNPCDSLSGGNQQKVVVGNWLNTDPLIMMYDEPSRGIDVNAKQQIFEIMWAQARKGVSSIFVSTELEELLEVCHRILIMKNGKIVGQVDPDICSVEELYATCMSGVIPEKIMFSNAVGNSPINSQI
ncbi:putative ribose/galactose/methyl galactoside import ATP-binding protein 2 [Spirochaetia bacterium]|nr:putative ribose/galactose/methyl galactoside import ATP-binding protein 2 [Spirochaetia bacterium]